MKHYMNTHKIKEINILFNKFKINSHMVTRYSMKKLVNCKFHKKNNKSILNFKKLKSWIDGLKSL
jgi:hypothetical protein